MHKHEVINTYKRNFPFLFRVSRIIGKLICLGLTGKKKNKNKWVLNVAS